MARATIISEVFQVCFFFEKCLLDNHEKTTVRAFLETKGPRDAPWMRERQILFRIALTRALYDRMAPQLCLFYVLGQPSKTVKRSVRKKHMVWWLRKHRLDKRKVPIGPICIRFLYKTLSTGIFLLSGRCFLVNSLRQKNKRPAPIGPRINYPSKMPGKIRMTRLFAVMVA